MRVVAKYNVSFDEFSDRFSYIQSEVTDGEAFSIRDIISDSYEYFLKFLEHLPKIDQETARLYYIDRLSQTQIANMLGVCQAAVSYRLKCIMGRIKFIIKMPTLNPLQVREDFAKIFPPELHEFAYLFYFFYSQNRVKNFILTSQSGASNKHAQIVRYLEDIVNSRGEEDTVDERQYLAMVYLEYFQYLRKCSNIFSCLFKKKGARKFNTFRKRRFMVEPR